MTVAATTRLIFYLAFLQALLLVAIIASTYVIRTKPTPGDKRVDILKEDKELLQVRPEVKRSCPGPECSVNFPTTLAKLKQNSISINSLKKMLDQNIERSFALPVVKRTGLTPPTFVILTTTNSNFASIMDNWLESLRRLRVRYNITLMSEDNETFSYFARRSNSEFRVILSSDLITPGRLGRNIPTYQQIIRKRTVYIYTLLKNGRDVLLSDVDTVWIKDPLPLIFKNYQHFDIWIAQGREPNFPCPCFFYLKSIPRVIELVLRWIQVLAYSEKVYTDQNALAMLLRSPEVKVKVDYLGYELFPLGSQYFNDTWHTDHANKVYIVHGNHLGRGEEKIAMFRKHGIWYLDRGQ
ncbi:uncharacterized protein [Apostichopus japonicus]